MFFLKRVLIMIYSTGNVFTAADFFLPGIYSPLLRTSLFYLEALHLLILCS